MLDALSLKVKRRRHIFERMKKIAIVTGATGGIGKEIARGLVKMGATVIVGARNPSKGDATVSELRKDAKDPNDVASMIVDVSSIASVRAFAEEFQSKHDGLDILVNNAGAWFSDRRESVGGHELTLATNVIGPYLATKLLADRLREGARVVNVVSSFAANYDASDLEWSKRKFDGFKTYAQSKQALRMLTWHFAEQLASKKIAVNAAAPGFVKSDFNQNATGFVATMIGFSAKLFAVGVAEGADTPLWVASSPDVDGVTNEYFEKRKMKDGKFREPAAIAELVAALDAMIAGARVKAA
jgi:NAD(P)-dependent dehydrogenase (short-subunit alcohol dehydrogenase family)